MKYHTISDLHFYMTFMLRMRLKGSLAEIASTYETFTQHDYINLVRKNWEDTVDHEDIVIFLGDISFRRKTSKSLSDILEEIKDYNKSTKIIAALPGRKIWIKGNHERGFLGDMKSGKLMQDVNELVKSCTTTSEAEKAVNYKNKIKEEIDKLFENLFIAFENIEDDPLRLGNIIFSHEPVYNIAPGLINIHGHIHEGLTDNLLNIFSADIFLNVNVEFTEYKPFTLALNENNMFDVNKIVEDYNKLN